jgi:hypothetical protein
MSTHDTSIPSDIDLARAVELEKAVEQALYNFLYGDEEGQQPARQFKEHFMYAMLPLLREAMAQGVEEAADYLDNRQDFGVSGYEYRQKALTWCRARAAALR